MICFYCSNSYDYQKEHKLQDFLFEGHFDSDVWNIESPITGEFIIRKCMSTISSVELQLIRVETISINDAEIREGMFYLFLHIN